VNLERFLKTLLQMAEPTVVSNIKKEVIERRKERSAKYARTSLNFRKKFITAHSR
jgi:hypothetical protein